MEPLDRPDGLESTGEFLFKDIVLLGVCVVLLLASPPKVLAHGVLTMFLFCSS
ncbi:hypothetical protein [Bradyrhizobium sp. RP6]|uniref:hypothetical protein n=1 Tax=Bradyrhizobium sp. RP6 TaxID=2489596 RepID=UPI0018F5E756|nr:hypothetical protein [Bradyrhizobium sp. RP6]